MNRAQHERDSNQQYEDRGVERAHPRLDRSDSPVNPIGEPTQRAVTQREVFRGWIGQVTGC